MTSNLKILTREIPILAAGFAGVIIISFLIDEIDRFQAKKAEDNALDETERLSQLAFREAADSEAPFVKLIFDISSDYATPSVPSESSLEDMASFFRKRLHDVGRSGTQVNLASRGLEILSRSVTYSVEVNRYVAGEADTGHRILIRSIMGMDGFVLRMPKGDMVQLAPIEGLEATTPSGHLTAALMKIWGITMPRSVKFDS